MRPSFRTLKDRAAFCLRHGFESKAWTGGSDPRPLSEITGFEREYVSALFAEQVTEWVECWGDLPKMDTVRLFWDRARHDAHATCRDSQENPTKSRIIGHYFLYEVEHKDVLLPWQKAGLQYTRSGYGSRIPSSKMIRLPGDKRWRRVYVCLWSNNGTAYVEIRGKWVTID